MCVVSVLMSIYNEPYSYIEESVQSILNQTLNDFEFIIVNDNPARKDIIDYILSFNDTRIKLVQNNKNIGLAESMNKAASFSSAQFLARMDCDDIAEPERLLEEYTVMKGGNYDCVFSEYSYIDKDSKFCGENPRQLILSENELKKKILTKSLIHHPTVMINRDFFEKVGGYRDFPCAQDIDLWQRMYYSGCRFHMIPKKLLKYRINPSSISSMKWYQQQLTIYYIDQLFLERLKTGNDSYSKNTYEDYILKNKYQDIAAANKLRKAVSCLKTAGQLTYDRKKIKAFFYRFIAFCISDKLRNNYITRRKILRLCKLT